MKRWMAAVAMLVATQAGAATLEPLTSGGQNSVTPGSSHFYSYAVGPLDQDWTGYNAWTYKLSVNGVQDYSTVSGVFQDGATPSNAALVFSYTYGAVVPDALTVNGVLELYIGAKVNSPGEFNNASQPVFLTVSTVPGVTKTTTVPFDPVSLFLNGATPKEQLTTDEAGLRAQALSAVPIGGTLPLMVSALGLFGWLLRRGRVAAA